MKKLIFLLFIASEIFAQNAINNFEKEETKAVRNPVEFNHLPVFLLKIKPTSMLAYNNTFQYGIEIAPPFGKFSFNFDYGTGKGSLNTSKYIRQNQAQNKNTLMSGEIRMYFSDWYPFYAMDKKPFGRYYAIEYFNGKFDKSLDMAMAVGGVALLSYAKFEKRQIEESRQGINFKFGKHFLISKFLIIDAFAGLGVGYYKSNFTDNLTSTVETVPLHYSFLSNRNIVMPGSKGLYFSKTLGFRLAFPI